MKKISLYALMATIIFLSFILVLYSFDNSLSVKQLFTTTSIRINANPNTASSYEVSISSSCNTKILTTLKVLFVENQSNLFFLIK